MYAGVCLYLLLCACVLHCCLLAYATAASVTNTELPWHCFTFQINYLHSPRQASVALSVSVALLQALISYGCAYMCLCLLVSRCVSFCYFLIRLFSLSRIFGFVVGSLPSWLLKVFNYLVLTCCEQFFSVVNIQPWFIIFHICFNKSFIVLLFGKFLFSVS